MSKDRSFQPTHLTGQESVYDEAHGPAKKKRKLAHNESLPNAKEHTITLEEWKEKNGEREEDPNQGPAV